MTASTTATAKAPAARVFVVGASGYIGRHVVTALVKRGHHVTCLVRSLSFNGPAGADIRRGDVTDAAAVREHLNTAGGFDAVVSCLATRSGAVADSWRIERDANLNVLAAACDAGVGHFVLLSAICVQRPMLAFQHAKLAFEQALASSGLRHSIVRPTAFFKSLSGQVRNVSRGGAFALFGDGTLTACKPISERDLAAFIVDCVEDPDGHAGVLPVGGPGPAITPRQQGELLFALAGKAPRFRHVPVALFDVIIGALSLLGRFVPRLNDKAEFARTGRYYATESMLLLDSRGAYDADATPSYGSDTLRDFYARVLVEGLAGQELGDHALFARDER